MTDPVNTAEQKYCKDRQSQENWEIALEEIDIQKILMTMSRDKLEYKEAKRRYDYLLKKIESKRTWTWSE